MRLDGKVGTGMDKVVLTENGVGLATAQPVTALQESIKFHIEGHL